MDPSRSPPPPSSSSLTSFPILAITILGILTTAVLLVSYYVFVINCSFRWRRPDLLRRILSATMHSRHDRGGILYIPPIVHIPTGEFRGLDQSAIRALPVVRFSAAAGEEEAAALAASSHECSVCLSEFQEGESLKLLPGCCHAFHIDCIDTWLQFNANCPLCRSVITNPTSQLTDRIVVLAPRRENDCSVTIDVRDEPGGQSSRAEGAPVSHAQKKNKKSMGDECIGLRAAKDEQFMVQPMRRSFSMDSSNDRHLYLSLQEMLRNRQQGLPLHINETSGEGSSNGGGGAIGRLRRSFFSFGRSSRSAVLPVQMDMKQTGKHMMNA